MNLRRLLFSHYVYNGIGGAAGVFLAGIIGYFLGGWVVAAIMTSGASIPNAVDNPCPPRDKFAQVVPSLVFSLLITLVVPLSHALWWQLLWIVFISMGASVISAFGRDALGFSFTLLYSLILAMVIPLPDFQSILVHLGWFAAGGAFYCAFVIAREYLMEVRTKQQVLAECLYQFARYLQIRAQLFDDLTEKSEVSFANLIRQQAVLTDKLQVSRNILFQRVSPGRGGYMVSTLFSVFEAYESSMSCNQNDLRQLLLRYGNEPIMQTLGSLMRRSASDLDGLSESVMRNTQAPALPDYRPQLAQAAQQIQQLRLRDGASPHIALLQDLYDSMGLMLRQISRLEQTLATRANAEPESPLELDEAGLKAFTSPNPYNLSMLPGFMRTNSPAMRYALRMTLAMMTGFLIASLLPYAAHSYWVLLTISVVMKSSYSLTKQRGAARILGTAAACILAGLILYIYDHQFFILICLFVSIAIARTMVTLRYSYTAAAASVMGLLQIHMLNPGAQFLIRERLIDTLVGALIAYLFSFILPNWEHRNLPMQVKKLSDACAAYARQALAFAPNTTDYRQTRRQFHDALSAFSQTIDRMLDEPKTHQLPLAPLETTAAQGYQLAAHLAAVRSLIITRGHRLNTILTTPLLNDAREKVIRIVLHPHNALNYPENDKHAAQGQEDSADADVSILLQQRLEQLDTEAVDFAKAMRRVLKSHQRMGKQQA